MNTTPRPAHAELLRLKRWNTPTVYNGWEQITKHNVARDGINREETRDFMPQMGPMVGYAVTLVIQPSDRSHQSHATAWSEYRRYVATEKNCPGPKIVVVQDLDKPAVIGSFWGEVNSNVHRTLGCVGTITDGAVRDIDEMTNAGFKAIARRLCVGHAFVAPVKWGCDVVAFGTRIQPGQLIHADKHGFLAIPQEDEARLLEASSFMDGNENSTLIPTARSAAGKPMDQILAELDAASAAFGAAAKAKFGKKGEW